MKRFTPNQYSDLEKRDGAKNTSKIGLKRRKKNIFLRGIKRKFKNKNLSEAKVQKWKEQNAENSKKYEVSETEREKRIESAAPQTQQWIDFIKAVADSNCTNRIGLLLHDYSGKHGNKIKIQNKKAIPIQELTPQTLLEIKEDVIYEFFSQI